MFDSFILAGGRSSRMGSDKAFARIGGLTLVERARDTLAGAGSKRVHVVTASGASGYDPIRGAAQISDIYKDRGALGGIHAALSNCLTKYAFILACDYPFVTKDLVQKLFSVISESSVDCLVPVQPDGRIQPLCSVFAAARSLPPLQRILDEREETPSVRQYLNELNGEFVPFEDLEHLRNARRFFFNVNTPADLRAAVDLESRAH